MKVFLYERQLEMPGGMTYFPYASGLLVAYARKYLPSWTFEINKPAEKPDIAAFSVSLWNRNYCLSEAMRIRERNPRCKFIFGGPSAATIEVPNAQIIEGDGEAAFLKAISGIDASVDCLDDIPSPYLTGVFNGVKGTQAIVETCRGCPFSCAYCYWGKGAGKIRFHSIDYVAAEAEWIGAHKISYVFCADGNFGMWPRDVEIAKIYANVKRRYGYPEKFRVCYGKNASVNIFETASILAEAGLSKSVTLSPQSRNTETLQAIGRKNISREFFDEMQARYDAAGIPVYSELILGLPGETYESFKEGLIETMSSGNQLFVYMCESLPATRLSSPEYAVEHGIVTRRIPVTPVHCRPLDPMEYEDIVVGTSTMSETDWKRSIVLAWMVQLYYSFKVLELAPRDMIDFCMDQIENNDPASEYFASKADDILAGRGRCDLINGIYFEPEEVAYLKYFGKGGDPVKEVIHARKNNFRKEQVQV